MKKHVAVCDRCGAEEKLRQRHWEWALPLGWTRIPKLKQDCCPRCTPIALEMAKAKGGPRSEATA